MNLLDLLNSVLGPATQATRLLRLHTPLGADALLAEQVRIEEHIGPQPGPARAGLRLEVFALSADTHLALKSLLGQPVLLELLTQHSRSQLRPWHGHVTEAALLGSDGGLARYRLVVEPWLAFLGHRQDSWVFQGRTVMEIIEEVFADHAGQGHLAPAWRWDLADPAVYPQRSLCIQYQETDLAFVQRLLREEGLFAWWEHEGDAGSPALGCHTLVMADHNDAIAANAHEQVRYTQTGAALPEDSLTRWQRSRRVHTATLGLASRDYRTRALRETAQPGSGLPPAAGLERLGLHDVPGLYAYETYAQGERLARVQIEALDAQREQASARGSWRTAAPGTRFTLRDHPVHDGSDAARDSFVVLAVEHRARNNLGADEQARVDQLLGPPVRQQGGAPRNAGDEPVYECIVHAQPARLPVRMAATEAPEPGAHGLPALPDVRLHPRPTITGVQTALVVGLGEPVHTDRDHRIKVQFHWQRGSNASHRLSHPGGDNAPASDASGTWVRVAESVAGTNWGANFVPRLGQEVLVAFVGGDIDRPVVVGSLYNGQGQPDAQGNRVLAGAAGAVGAADAWFPGGQPQGRLPGHQHAQVFSGYKSQELASSQNGFGGHNQLVFDDTPGEGRIELFSSSAQTRLQLGHLRHQIDNRRLDPRGHGTDLATAAWGAVRAGSGLLLSAHGRPGSQQMSRQLDASEPQAQLEDARQRLHTLAESAQQHNAKAPGEPDTVGAQRSEGARLLAAERGLVASLDSLAATDTRGGLEGDAESIGGGAGTVPAWGRPDLVVGAPAGIGAFTPAAALLTAGATFSVTAGQDIQSLAQGHHAVAVKEALILYTHGKAQNPAKPNQETGISLHAATGNVQTQSQTGPTHLAADRRVQVVSTTGKVTIAAPTHILLAANGAAIRMQGGEISCTGPGSVLYKASLKVFDSPGGSVPFGFACLPRPDPIKPTDLEFRRTYPDGTPIPALPYTVRFSDGSQRKGRTDAAGMARLADVPPGSASVVYGLDPNAPEASVQLALDDDFQQLFGGSVGAGA